MNDKANKPSPSIDLWLKEAKKDHRSAMVGMFLTHNGVVRETPKMLVRQGLDSGDRVTGMDFSYDQAKVDEVIKETYKLEGVYYIKAWLNQGHLDVGDDIMYILIGGDIRPHVVDALQYMVGKIKSECVIEVEEMGL
jgi:molybdopterin synthase catalytic subunit